MEAFTGAMVTWDAPLITEAIECVGQSSSDFHLEHIMRPLLETSSFS